LAAPLALIAARIRALRVAGETARRRWAESDARAGAAPTGDASSGATSANVSASIAIAKPRRRQAPLLCIGSGYGSRPDPSTRAGTGGSGVRHAQDDRRRAATSSFAYS
jgi:hypothetical protein